MPAARPIRLAAHTGRIRLILRPRAGVALSREISGPSAHVSRQAAAERLGLPVSWGTLRRLIHAGFVRCVEGVLDMESLTAHLRASARPGFWTAERVARWEEVRAMEDCR